MKFGNKKVVATIVAMAMATGFTGCSKDENSLVQSDSDTEKDLLTSSSSIDIWSAQESIDSTLNSYDTSKPIEKDENPTGDASSDDGTSSDANGDLTSSDLTDDKSDNGTSNDDESDSDNGTSDGDKSDSTGETSKPSDSTLTDDKNSSANSDNGTSDSDSSNSSLTDDKSDSVTTVTNEEFKAVFGYDIPEGATEINLERGTYRLGSVEKWSEAALAARDEAIRKGHEAIENGTYGKVTSDQAAELDKIFFG